MTTPTSPIAAVKLLCEALEFVIMRIPMEDRDKRRMQAALDATASIEQPASEAANRVAVLEEIAALHEKYFVRSDTFDAGYFIDSIRSMKDGAPPAAQPANHTDAQKLTTLRDGLAKFGWCAEFGALAQEVLFPPVDISASTKPLSEKEKASEIVDISASDLIGAPVDERAAAEAHFKVNFSSEHKRAMRMPFSQANYSLDGFLRGWAARAALQQPGQADKARLDWLEAATENGFLSMCFEMDGGVFLRLEGVGEDPEEYRNQNTIRDAIDAALKRAAAPSPQEKPSCGH